MKTNRRKLVVYRSEGKLDYFEYHLNGVWKNQQECEAWLGKHPNYEYGSIQIIRSGPKARRLAWQEIQATKSMNMGEIMEYCENRKRLEKESKPAAPKDESEYLYKQENADEWMAVAKENGWNLNDSIKPLCEHLGLSPVVVAPVLQRYGYIQKKVPLPKTYKYSKEQVEVWWNEKIREGLTINQLADKVGVHFLQLGRVFTQYGFQPKKEKKEKVGRGRKKKNKD